MVLERRVYVHALESLELLETLETAQNAKGVCALTVCAKPCLLALPSSAASGTLRIHDLLAGGGGSVLSELSAHKLNVVSPTASCRVARQHACRRELRTSQAVAWCSVCVAAADMCVA